MSGVACSTEKCECTCRCEKGLSIFLAAALSTTSPSPLFFFFLAKLAASSSGASYTISATGVSSSGLNHPFLYQAKETAGGGMHVIGGIVGIVKSFAKQLYVQLGKRWPFKLSATAGNGHKIGCFIFGIDGL